MSRAPLMIDPSAEVSLKAREAMRRMGEHAAGIGARFRIRSRPGHGTEVEVVLL